MITISLENLILSTSQNYIPLVYISKPYISVGSYIDELFPEFVREDHPRFITFIKAYYEWMESRFGVIGLAKNLKNEQDIDEAIDPYVDGLLDEFLVNFPKNTSVDRALLLKHVKNFYRTKGTEKSYEILFRILYGLNPEFYYPRTDILKVSDGKWAEERSIRILNVSGNISNFVSRRIRGTISNTTAYVERIAGLQKEEFIGHELFLNRSSITGKFLPNEVVVVDEPEATTNATVSAVASSITIINAGIGYLPGTIFKIDYYGKGIEILVESVEQNGAIKSIKILEYGIGYDTLNPIVNWPLIVNGPSQIATINVNFAANITHSGYYLNEDGQVSTAKYIQDGHYYQQFSYVVFIDDVLSRYKNSVDKLVHPVGFKLFGGFRTQPLLNGKLSVPIGDLKETLIRRLINKVKVTSNIITKFSLISEIQRSKNSVPMGPSVNTLYHNRFKFKPVSAYNANDEIFATPNYFGTNLANKLAITSIAKFDEIGLSPKILDQSGSLPVNLVPDSCVLNVVVKKNVSINTTTNQITLNSTSGLVVGMRVVDSNQYIPEHTKIISITGNVIQISNNTTSGGTTDITFNYY